jgi:hypothetical protein
MQKIKCTLTVFFEQPFWVGVCEKEINDNLEVSKFTFGSEPKDYEIYDFLLHHWDQLHFSTAVKTDFKQQSNMNPKRMQRAIRKQLQAKGIGTKAQEALKLQYEESKLACKEKHRQKKDIQKQQLYEIKQQKRKQKHRGK